MTADAAHAADEALYATLRAHATLAGWTLVHSEISGYYAHRWGRVIHLGDLQAVRVWIERVTGKATA